MNVCVRVCGSSIEHKRYVTGEGNVCSSAKEKDRKIGGRDREDKSVNILPQEK